VSSGTVQMLRETGVRAREFRLNSLVRARRRFRRFSAAIAWQSVIGLRLIRRRPIVSFCTLPVDFPLVLLSVFYSQRRNFWQKNWDDVPSSIRQYTFWNSNALQCASQNESEAQTKIFCLPGSQRLYFSVQREITPTRRDIPPEKIPRR